MTKSSLTDAELWDLIVNDDDYRAFLALFKRNWATLYRTAFQYVKDEAGAEEVVNDLFLNIWNRRKFLIIADLTKYFKASTRYHAFDYLQKKKSVLLEYKDNLDESSIYCMNQAQENFLYHDLEQKLNQYLNHLPGRCKEIFVLSRIQNLSNQEIAERLGISKRSVENQITHALKYIRFNIKNIAVLIAIILKLS